MRPQIVLFGDDHTEQAFTVVGSGGWAAGLAKSYSRKADVIVRGYNDYNTNLALLMLDRIFPLKSPTPPIATIVFFGCNDAAILGASSTRQHVPPAEYKENLRDIVNHLKDCSLNMLVVLITPLPVNDEARMIYACDDGLHLTYGGNNYVRKTVLKKLKVHGLDPSQMQIDFRLADEIDFNAPEPYFEQ